MMSIGYRFQIYTKSHTSPTAPSCGYHRSNPGLLAPASPQLAGHLQCWRWEMAAPQLPLGLQSGSAPRPRGDSPPCADLGRGGRGKKNFPTWAEMMGTKPRSPGTDCRGGGNVSSAPRRLNGLLKKPFVSDPFFFPKLAGSAPRGNL